MSAGKKNSSAPRLLRHTKNAGDAHATLARGLFLQYRAVQGQRAAHVRAVEERERSLDVAVDALDTGLEKASILVDETAVAVNLLVDHRRERNTELKKLLKQASDRSRTAATLEGLGEDDLALLHEPGSAGWKREELHITADHIDIEALLFEHERREKEAARRAAVLQLGRKNGVGVNKKDKRSEEGGRPAQSLGRSIYNTY